jgi:suppressor of ftsI
LIAPEKVVLRRGITRRHLLGAAGLGGLALLSKPAWSQAVLGIQPPRGQALTQPPEIRSENGVLNATLTASPGLVRLGEFAFPGFVYNDAYIPPLLRVRPGDTMRIGFRNQLPDDPSNLHYHGMSVSPQGNSDNVFVHVHPGAQFDYEVRIPGNGRQGPGLFWYHPHAHGFVAKQILGGMSGGLVVEGSDRLYPILSGLPERFFLIKHTELGEGNEIMSINGQLNPLIDIRPGEMQFWRIAHIGATLFIKFRIDGMPLYVVARDGHPLTQPQKVTEVLIGPGERIDAIAVGPDAGEYAVTTIPFQNEAWKKPDPAQQLATVASGGGARPSSGAESEILNQRVEGDAWIDTVRATPIAKRRELTYSRTPDRKVFMIDHRVMEEDRVDQTAKLGCTEEWTVINTDQQYHSFHIHQTGFLVTAVNGVPQRELSLRDTVSIPPATDQSQGVLKVVIPFTDPVIAGRFFYHCHAVDHEDKGMMGVIEVVG